MKNISKLLALSLLGIALAPLFAKEPAGIIIGAGVGEGRSEMSIEHAHIAKNPLQSLDPNNPGAPQWTASVDSSAGSWAIAWELLVGYKHFLNDIIGFRYYANVGIQHYKPVTYKSKEQPIGYVDYMLNADVLLDFYTDEFFSFGILGGVGLGGMSLDRRAINEYESIYNANAGVIPIGASDITKHFLNINFSAGVRMIFFQKTSVKGGIRSCDNFSQGRRSCTMPSAYIGHGFEVVAKFPTLTYAVTTPDFVMSTQGGTTVSSFRSRPGYKIKNPYRFTFRYVVEF